MRLTTITTDDPQLEVILRRLLAQMTPQPIAEQVANSRQLRYGQIPFSYFILESIAESPLLTEAAQSGLSAILQAGIARLRAALMPKTGPDLDMLLTFMAPQRGGSKAVQQLLTSAKSLSTPLVQSEDWWTNLFATLGIDDTRLQDDIKQKVMSEFGGAAVQQSTPQSAAASGQAVRNKVQPKSYADEFNQERDDMMKHREEVMAMLTQAKQDRAHAATRMRELRGQSNDLMSRYPREEEASNAALTMMLEYPCVQKHLQSYVKVALRRLGASGPIQLNENLFDNLRTMMANPGYAKNQAQQIASANDNERAAKLALQIALGHLRNKFKGTLQDAGLLPDDITKTYESWRRMRQGGDPNLVRQLEEKLKNAFRLFNVKSGGGQGELGPDPLGASPGAGPGVQQPQAPPVQAPPVQAPPVQAPPQQPAIGLANDTRPFAREVAQRMILAAAQAAKLGRDPLAAAKQVAAQAHRINPQVAQLVWHHFQTWWQQQQATR